MTIPPSFITIAYEIASFKRCGLRYNFKMENWKEIKGYEGLYECSTHGRVRTVARIVKCKNGTLKSLSQRILTPHFNSNGYLWVFLHKEGVRRFWLIHRLIALTFVANPDNKPFVNHKSGVKTDNVPHLLEWSTRKENVAHAFKTGLMSHAGEKNSQSKLTAQDVLEIRRLFATGVTRRDLATRFQISYSRIRDVINRNCWLEIQAEQCA